MNKDYYNFYFPFIFLIRKNFYYFQIFYTMMIQELAIKGQDYRPCGCVKHTPWRHTVATKFCEVGLYKISFACMWAVNVCPFT